MFGEGADAERYYYVQYNEALKDTLLGMRLLQADILFISLAEHWRLPKYNGQMLLGAGEKAPTQAQSIAAGAQLEIALHGQQWRSWVLTDAGTQPTFGASDGALTIKSVPYYYFWNLDEDDFKAKTAAREKLISQYESTFKEYDGNLSRYNSLVPTFNAATTVARQRELEKQLDALKGAIDRQQTWLESTKAKLESEDDEPRVYEVAALTSAMKALDRTLSEYNSSVYRAYQRLAQFASFFRYVRDNNPSNWIAFRQTVSAVSVTPTVKTPTTWERAHR